MLNALLGIFFQGFDFLVDFIDFVLGFNNVRVFFAQRKFQILQFGIEFSAFLHQLRVSRCVFDLGRFLDRLFRFLFAEIFDQARLTVERANAVLQTPFFGYQSLFVLGDGFFALSQTFELGNQTLRRFGQSFDIPHHYIEPLFFQSVETRFRLKKLIVNEFAGNFRRLR